MSGARALERRTGRRVAVMVSGSGRTLSNLHGVWDTAARAGGKSGAEIAVVIASKECAGASLARERGLNVRVMEGEIPGAELAAVVRGAGAEWVVLAGYLKRVRVAPELAGRVVNIHPALLPSFGGPGMFGLRVHRAVLEAGCKVSGCTVHLCDENYDTGPILVQAACEVKEGDTPESLAARVFSLECGVYPRAIETLMSGRVRVEGGRARILGG